jgi:hypothetical protein
MKWFFIEIIYLAAIKVYETIRVNFYNKKELAGGAYTLLNGNTGLQETGFMKFFFRQPQQGQIHKNQNSQDTKQL